jgi:hypothetical protein
MDAGMGMGNGELAMRSGCRRRVKKDTHFGSMSVSPNFASAMMDSNERDVSMRVSGSFGTPGEGGGTST